MLEREAGQISIKEMSGKCELIGGLSFPVLYMLTSSWDLSCWC
jgi:hypothetical protein